MTHANRDGKGELRRRRPSEQKIAAPPARQRYKGSYESGRRSHERYLALAREATLSGDIIEIEDRYQHAEHYFRVIISES